MISTLRQRLELFIGTSTLLGRPKARELSSIWRDALQAHPEIAADLIRLSGMMELHIDGAGNPLSDAILRERAAQADLVRMIFARAELTITEINRAMKEVGDEELVVGNDGVNGAYAEDGV